MKKILGIIGSPRKLGNSEIMIKEISRHISMPHQLNLIRLSDFNILPCRGCYRCLFKEERCILDDELPTVLNSIIEADALIVATPTYFLGANSSLKRLMDRGLAFYAHGEALWGKPAVGIGALVEVYLALITPSYRALLRLVAVLHLTWQHNP